MIAGRVNHRSLFFLVLSAVFVSFAVYFLTLSRSVGWHDSAELALAAWRLGASHAPGSPVHSLLGHLMTQLYEEPYRGTSLLSALCASASAGILALLIYALKRNASVAFFGALVYAFSFQVWASAVVTEVYSLSMLFLSISLLYAWLWCDGGKWQHFAVWMLAYALALGAYFANILLFPAFAYLVYRAADRKAFDLLILAAITGLTIVLIASANYLLAQNALPFGEVAPDSLLNMLLYMSGSQHAPLQVRDSAFILTRFIQHTEIFSRSLLFIGIPLGLLGAVALMRMHKSFGGFTVLIFAIYMVYYTVFGPGDYFMMVLPAYFVFSIWLAFGVLWLVSCVSNQPLQWVCRLLPVLLVGALLAFQIDGRRLMARSMETEDFAEVTFKFLPRDAIAITGWKEFTPLQYYQQVRATRPDIRFIVPARSVRRYRFGEVPDYVDFIGSAICSAPVYATKVLPDLGDQYEFHKDNADSTWMLVTRIGAMPPDSCL